MCVIIACETKKPSLDMLKKYENVNSDGGGMAWIGKDRLVHWNKGISAEQIHQITMTVDLPFVIHFRIATAGGVSAQLCHPFPIDEQASTKIKGASRAVLFQNGHWSNWQDSMILAVAKSEVAVPSGPWSDTRCVAWLQGIYERNILEFVDGGKFAVLNRRGIRIFGKGWDTYEDCIVSNKFLYSYRFGGHYDLDAYGEGEWTRFDYSKVPHAKSCKCSKCAEKREEEAAEAYFKTSVSGKYATLEREEIVNQYTDNDREEIRRWEQEFSDAMKEDAI